jgi:hypothetical protein
LPRHHATLWCVADHADGDHVGAVAVVEGD